MPYSIRDSSKPKLEMQSWQLLFGMYEANFNISW